MDGYFVTEGVFGKGNKGLREVGEIREVGMIRLTDITQC